MKLSLYVFSLLVALAVACNSSDQIAIDLLAHDDVTSLQIGDQQVDPQMTISKFLGIRVSAGDYEVSWKIGGSKFKARISVHSNEDNYLILTEKEPWLAVDGGIEVLEPARRDGT